jgi:hypothetical protein
VTAHTPGPWVIDNRSHYDWPAGGHQAPLQLGAVVAECPTAFGGITIRDPSTIGKPCPTVAELDALGLRHAHLCKAAPCMLAALKALVKANEDWNADVQAVIGRPPHWTDGYLDEARAAIASAEGRG